MTSIAERLLKDLGTAMRDKDATRRDVLRYLRSEIHNAEIAQGRKLSDDETEQLVHRQINQRREAAEQFAKGNRQDLVDSEAAQIAVLQQYLPPQLSPEELEAMADDIAAQLGLSGSGDMGKIMGPLREKVGSRAEGKAVASAARGVLERRAQEDTGT